MAVAYSTNGSTARNGQLSMFFIVKRSGTSAELQGTTLVDFETADVTAVAGKDYTATSGQLTFASGVTEQTVSVALLDAAYDNSAAVTFVFALPSYASVGATIDPTSDGQSVQAYLVIPDTSTTEQVPTTDLIDDDTTNSYRNIKYQTDYKKLGDGDSTTIDTPFAYLRLGYTRADVNDYERVIVNSDDFQPKWMGDSGAGEPRERGPLAKRMLPRGIDRQSDPGSGKNGQTLDQLKANSANLDGIFLYTAQNYTVTVGRHLNQVIQGDKVEFVGGHMALVAMQGNASWVYYGGGLRSASGLDKVNGAYWRYDITDASELKISTKSTVEYSLDLSFSASASASLIVNNNVKYTVTNGVEMNVQGLSAQINGDIMGYYGIKLAGSIELSNAFALLRVASQRVCFQVNPVMSKTAANTVAASSAILAAAGASVTTPGWISNFQSEKQFFNDSNSEELGSKYAETFTTALPYTIGTLATVNAGIVIAAAAMQAAASVIPITPTIELTPTALNLQVGESSIRVTNLGIWITAPMVSLSSQATVSVNAGAAFTINADTVSATGATSIGLTAPTTRVNGILQVAGNINATGLIQGNQLLA